MINMKRILLDVKRVMVMISSNLPLKQLEKLDRMILIVSPFKSLKMIAILLWMYTTHTVHFSSIIIIIYLDE